MNIYGGEGRNPHLQDIGMVEPHNMWAPPEGQTWEEVDFSGFWERGSGLSTEELSGLTIEQKLASLRVRPLSERAQVFVDQVVAEEALAAEQEPSGLVARFLLRNRS